MLYIYSLPGKPSEIPIKIKIYIAFDPMISLLIIYPLDVKTLVSEEMCVCVHACMHLFASLCPNMWSVLVYHCIYH